MTIKLDETYVGRVDTTDPDYQWGKGRNIQGGVPNTGTPFDEKWFNDFEGKKQALLRIAGIVPSGVSDSAVNSDQLEAMKRVQRGFLVGNPVGSFRYGFEFTSANDVGIDNDGNFWKYSGAGSYPITVAADTDPTSGDFTQAFARDGQINPVGNFSDGVTFNFPNDVARDATGEYWVWTGALPYTATAGTVPSSPDYDKVFYNSASEVNVEGGGSVQDYINENLTPFENIAAMRAYDYAGILDGSRIEWQGYYSQSDGGSNWGILKKGDSTSLTDDGGSIFIIVNDTINGVWVEASPETEINAETYGAFGDDATDYSINILKSLKTREKTLLPNGFYKVSSIDMTALDNCSLSGVGGGTVLEYDGTGNESVFKMGGTTTPSTRNQIRDLQLWMGSDIENLIGFDIDYFTNQSQMQDVEILNVGNNSTGFKFGNAWFAHCKRLTVVGNDNTKTSTGFKFSTQFEAINGIAFENLRAHTLGTGVDIDISTKSSYGCGIQNYNVELCKTGFKIRSSATAALTQFTIGGTSCYIENCETPFDIDSDISTATLLIENAMISLNSGYSTLKGNMKVIFDNCRWLKLDATDFDSVCIVKDCTVVDIIDPNGKVVVVNSEELGVDSVLGQTQGNQGGVSLYPVKRGRLVAPDGSQTTVIPNELTKPAPSGGYTSKIEIFAYRAVDLASGKRCYAEIHKKSNTVYGIRILDAISSTQDGVWNVDVEQSTGNVTLTTNLPGDHFIQYAWHLY